MGPDLRRGSRLLTFSIKQLELDMWKLVVGFVVIAAVTVWLLSKGGDIDMSGEKHGIDTSHAPAAASAPASAPSTAASQ
ncbi:hypothetical protein [Piscinibacter gummiphilus]|uniref:Uncharacterized protein n=1 Tax=Piscinibacter gummiphilus TaxID=946333 RepID=A0ABZ0D1I9_9BURK|nr:hypothetical protein [Piscinibacter gummiphilus]WOB09102.1 hypothetical protein RXV79_03365 [Piscinibacter gummiphilus]